MCNRFAVMAFAVAVVVSGASACTKPPVEPPREARRRVVPPSTGDVAQRALRVVNGRPFDKRDARVRVLPIKGGGAFVSNAPMVDKFAIVGTAPHHWGVPTSWDVIELATGAKRAHVLDVGDGSAATHSTVVKVGAAAHPRAALVRMDDGTLVEPHAILPNGGRVTDTRIVLDEHEPTTWLFAHRADGHAFDGQWTDTTKDRVELPDEMAFWPTHASGRNGIQAWGDFPEGGTGGCDRALLHAGEPLECRPAARVDAPPSDIVEECVRFDGESWLIDDCAKPLPVPQCATRPKLLLVSSAPARVLSACDEGKDTHFYLWSSARSWSWRDPGVWRGALRERGPRTLLPLEALVKSDAPVRHWLDVEHGVLFTSDPLVMVALSEHRDDHRRLVQPPDKPNELWVLDTDQGTVERIANDLQCDGRIHSYARTGDRATIECMPKAALGSLYRDEQRLSSWSWMEIVDLKQRVRWHTNEVFEARIGERGVVVGTKRGKPAQIAVVETP